jgi:serine/threonine protein kinase
VSKTLPNFLLSKYESVELIDKGADSSVFKCVRQDAPTAVKVLADPLDFVARRRFDQEVEILKGFDHPHVVKLLDAGETDGHHWLESEFAQQSHFGKMFPYLNYSNLQRRNCFVQILLGVLALHEADPQIIHRDLKPRNILVFDGIKIAEPVLKIADFGLSVIAGDDSHLTTSGQVLGTGLYMAPERIQNPFIKTTQSDIYSLGITFLEACTGEPTMGENLDNVPEPFKPIIRKMTRHKATDRYQTIREVLSDFNNLSIFQLIYGREIEPGEVPGPSFSTNTAGQLARIIEVMYNATSETIGIHVERLEQALDSLGTDVHDNKAHTIGSIPSHVAKLIDEVLPDKLCRLIERFDYAAEHTAESDFFYDGSDHWGWFLVEIFKASTYSPTRHACLASLSKVFVRFDTALLRHYIGHLMYVTKDPSDLQHFARCLREQNRENIAKLIDDLLEGRELDVQALRKALGIFDVLQHVD